MDLITLITLQEKNSELPVHVYLYVATLELDKMGLIHPGCSTAFLVSNITIIIKHSVTAPRKETDRAFKQKSSLFPFKCKNIPDLHIHEALLLLRF